VSGDDTEHTTADDSVHEAVMRATAETLAEEGYAGLTTRAVADRVDVSKSTLHYRYDTKEGLLAAFLRYNNDRAADLYAEFADAPPLERLVGVLDRNLDLLAEPPLPGLPPAYVELHARAARSEAFREAIGEGDRRYRTELADAVAAGVESGVFRDVDPEATATLLVAVPDSAGLTRHTLGDDDVIDRLRTALNEVVFASLLAENADVEGSELL
jgi:AcrR family transcriptional regulator